MIIKVGRLTAALLLVSVGAALLFDRWQGTAILGTLLEWWPLLLVLLGLEYLYYGLKPKGDQIQLKLDIASIIGAVLLSAVIGVITNWPSLSQLTSLTRNVSISTQFDGFDGWFEHAQPWQKVDKGVVSVPLSDNSQTVSFHNPNGRVTIQSGAVDDIQIAMLVSVPGASEEEVNRAAEGTRLEIKDGSTLRVSVESERYGRGIHRMPSVNLAITVPQGKNLTWEVHGTNGDLEVNGVDGMVKMFTTNGDVTAESIAGALEVNTTRGDVGISRTDGDIAAQTTLGDITVEDAQGALRLHTTNGDIEAQSEQIAGNWSLETTLGDVVIDLPLTGDYTIQGETTLGEVELDASGDAAVSAFDLSRKSIEGKIGSGKHRIDAQTQGDLEISLR